MGFSGISGTVYLIPFPLAESMRDRPERGMLEATLFATGDPSSLPPNTCNIAFEYIEGEAVLLLRNKVAIAA
jgi:cysteine desulfurase